MSAEMRGGRQEDKHRPWREKSGAKKEDSRDMQLNERQAKDREGTRSAGWDDCVRSDNVRHLPDQLSTEGPHDVPRMISGQRYCRV